MMQLSAFNDLRKTLSDFPVVRRLLLMNDRGSDDPVDNDGLEIAVDAPEATDTQWREIVDIVKRCEFELSSEPQRLSDMTNAMKERYIREATVIFDQSDSPTSPT
jgi:hypothetical protein